MDGLEAIKLTFFQECSELLADLEVGLLKLQSGEGDAETVNAVFRAVHSIKGGAGAFGLEDLVRFAHVFETTLDDVRAGRLEAAPAVVGVLLRAADVLADHVGAANGEGAPVDADRSAQIAQELHGLGGPAEAPAAEPAAADDGMDGLAFTPLQLNVIPLEPLSAPGPAVYQVRFRPHPEMYAKGNDAALLLRELERLGEMEVSIDASAMPLLEAIEPEGAYLAWDVALSTSEGETAIREVFEFVEGDCDLTISTEGSASPVAAGEGELDIQALIMAATAVQMPDAEMTPIEPVAAPSPLTIEPVSEAPAKVAPKPAAKTEAPAAAAGGASIRVDLERVDRLIDLVGELVINQAMLAQRVAESGLARSSTVAVGLDDLEQLTREIQDSVMAIRAQPVKSVFQRMPRLVREVAMMTGKQVRLVTEGEGTEVDKTVIERLTDPITHMIRNAIDHGLEGPEDRVAAGKAAEGVVRLAAVHRSGRIVIEVADDGAGINRTRVRQIAVDKGLIDPDVALTEEEVDNLIFLPGFSTAATVSDISGRGVGMDVVKRSITALGGRISITSQPGKGSTFTLSLPLTLAVLDGMVVSVAGQTLIAPLTHIVETLQPKAPEVRPLGVGNSVLAVRDAFVPLIDIGQALGWRDHSLSPGAGVVLLVESEVGARAAFLVDDIQGQRQVVIKSLEANYQQVGGIAAATILGDGRVALILDIDAVIDGRRRDGKAPDQLPRLAQAS